MRESTTEPLTQNQKDSIKALNKAQEKRRTRDMMELVKLPAFIRYVARVTKACGVHKAIEGSESNNVFYREGRRSVGEALMAEIRMVDFNAATGVEYEVHRDAQWLNGIKNDGKPFNAAAYLGKEAE